MFFSLTDDCQIGLGLVVPELLNSSDVAPSNVPSPTIPEAACGTSEEPDLLSELHDITMTGLHFDDAIDNAIADAIALAGLPINTSAAHMPSYAPGFELDALWVDGRVAVPPSSPDAVLKWPEGIYARDMAKAFDLIGEHRNKKVTLQR